MPGFGGVEGGFVVLGVGIAGIVPGAVHKGVHRVRLAFGGCAALGADGHVPFRNGEQGVGGGFAHLHVIRQQHRQIGIRNEYHAALRAVDHGNGIAPIALAGNAPVAQAVGAGHLAAAQFLDAGGDGGLGGFAVHTVEGGGIGDDPRLDIGLGHLLQNKILLWILDHQQYRDAVFSGKFKVTLVVRGHCHHRSSAVIHQHIVGHPDLHFVAVQRIETVSAAENTFLGGVFRGAQELVLVDHLVAKVMQFAVVRVFLQPFLHQRMLRRQGHEGDSIDGVRAGGEDGDALAFVFQGELDAGAFALADPMFLHQDHALGPVDQLAEVQQFLGVVRDAEIPLFQLFLRHFAVAAPALAVFHLLVGEHGLAFLTPVLPAFFAVNQPFFIELFEEELPPFVIFGAAGAYLALPIQAEAHEVELDAHGGDVFLGGDAGMGVVLDGKVLRWHAKGVVAHGLHHSVAFHHFQA